MKYTVACSALTGTIFAGRPNKAKTAFLADKEDVTMECIGAVLDHALMWKARSGKHLEIYSDNGPSYRMILEEIDGEAR